MNVQLLVAKIYETLRQEGLCAIFRKASRQLIRPRLQVADGFDLRYGTETGSFVPLWKLNIRSSNICFGTSYEATCEQELLDAFHCLNEDLHTFTFIDLGCGKGRTLLIASHSGFRQVIGVDFAEELVNIARNNLRKTRLTNVVVMHMDVAQFRFPDSDMVIYLYNPFSDEVMSRVVASLQTAASNRRVYVIYKVPQCAAVLDSSGFLQRVKGPASRRYIQVWKATD